MSLITNSLPESITVRGQEVSIDSDFRASITYWNAIRDNRLSNEEMIAKCLLAYFPNGAGLKQELLCDELVEQCMWFYKCGKTEQQIRQEKKLEAMTNGKEAFSFELDAELIQAAFMRQYGIDLNAIEYLHWWKFMALFKGLDDQNEIVKIMGYRTMKIDSKMSAEQKKFYKRLQAKYALPSKEKEQSTKDIEQSLIDGSFRGLEV